MKRPEDLSGETVLYGCLNWGSGHIARSIPVMRQLVNQGNKLIIWCTREQRRILESYSVNAHFQEEDLFTFRFRGDGHFTREMLRNANAFRKAVIRQRKRTTELVQQFGITAIISDHCYGLVSAEIPSYFITHQVRLPGKSGGIAQLIHRRWMERFQTIWIMDTSENRLAGNLSIPHPHACYIGHYSRFTGRELQNGGGIVAVISGPEPYAEKLFRMIVRWSETGMIPVTIIAPNDYGMQLPRSIQLISGDWQAADNAILKADKIISRNGYTTLMDLLVLKKPAVLIPTPGQTEQEYLATLNSAADWKIISGNEEDLVRSL